jgi:hypothetical protein
MNQNNEMTINFIWVLVGVMIIFFYLQKRRDD